MMIQDRQLWFFMRMEADFRDGRIVHDVLVTKCGFGAEQPCQVMSNGGAVADENNVLVNGSITYGSIS